MKTFIALFIAVLGLTVVNLHSQAPAPAPTAAETLQLLQKVKENNARMLEQQAKTLQTLEEMEKTSQTIKTLGKRA